MLRPDRELDKYLSIRHVIDSAKAEMDAIPVRATEAEQFHQLRVLTLRLAQDRAKAKENFPAIEGQPWTRYWGIIPPEPSPEMTLDQRRAIVTAEFRAAEARAAVPKSAAIQAWGIVLTPPAILFALGAAFIWAFRGFRRGQA